MAAPDGAASVSASVESTRNPDLRHPVDRSLEVHTLEALYDACRRSANSAELVNVVLHGPEGEVRLHFGGVVTPPKER
jgi:hypothetical protein